jgi:hypothetical protein
MVCANRVVRASLVAGRASHTAYDGTIMIAKHVVGELHPELSALVRNYVQQNATTIKRVEIVSLIVNDQAIALEAGTIVFDENNDAKIEFFARENIQEIDSLVAQTLNDGFFTTKICTRRSTYQSEDNCNRYLVEATEFDWVSRAPCFAWVGVLRGYRPKHFGNVEFGDSSTRAFIVRHMSGNLSWTLCSNEALATDECVVIVSNNAPLLKIDKTLFFADLDALQFTLGGPLFIDRLTGVTAQNYPAAMWRPAMVDTAGTASLRSPVKDSGLEHWANVAFPLVARAMAGESKAFRVAVHAYLSTFAGYVDVRYLVGQIALEAFSSATATAKVPLVRDIKLWKKWVDDIKPTIQAHALSPTMADIMAGKLKNAGQPTTGRVVADYFAACGITLPKPLQDELRGRAQAAHELSILRDESEFQTVMQRLCRVQTMLAAMILHRVGYCGALTGGPNEPTDWWPIDPEQSKAIGHRFRLAPMPEATE